MCVMSKYPTLYMSKRPDGPVFSIAVGARHFWLFGLLRAAEIVLYTYRVYHIHTLCIYTTIYMLSGPPAMTKGRPPTTMVFSMVEGFRLYQTFFGMYAVVRRGESPEVLSLKLFGRETRLLELVENHCGTLRNLDRKLDRKLPELVNQDVLHHVHSIVVYSEWML